MVWLQVTGESKWKHPLLPYYKGAVFMDQGGAAETQKTNQRSPCSDQEVGAALLLAGFWLMQLWT